MNRQTETKKNIVRQSDRREKSNRQTDRKTDTETDSVALTDKKISFFNNNVPVKISQQTAVNTLSHYLLDDVKAKL